ncbi:hypothetical protein HK099_008217 [Clydaea vesicula]|uniref:Phospholipid-transporting ATPase n=1 Tax=Clydaea vesicula TaxID=447962 RepID=A0AAD5XT94_9FUNG|nr:hypothetical protein HK099_008217 [Clydaea vesicula]
MSVSPSGRKISVEPALRNQLHSNYDPPKPFFSKKIERCLPGFISKSASSINSYFSKNSNSNFINNKVKTARYSIIDFLPKQLFFQFSKFANLYFLFISILQYQPDWSPTGRYTTIIPLSIFVAISMVREAYDDVQRHKQDSSENNTLTKRLRIDGAIEKDFMASLARRSATLRRAKSEPITPSDTDVNEPFLEEENKTNFNNISLSWESIPWRKISVGDIIKVEDKEIIPADLILLKTDHEDGTCYIETANLDGETNLKQRSTLPATRDFLKSDFKLLKLKASIHGESPNGSLYNFEGYLEIDGQKHPLTSNQLLLRGSTLANSGHILGVATYTGEESKIRMNANSAVRSKSPVMEKITNKIVLLVFTSVLILAGVGTVSRVFWERAVLKGGSAPWYLKSQPTDWVATFFSFVILFNALIPISLYVTLELIKLAQIFFINKDLMMYCEKSQSPAEARTSSLNEDLGQVQYLFSDKTGTLTENVMIFRKISVSSLPFSFVSDEKSSLFSKADILTENYIKDLKKHTDQESDYLCGVEFLKAISLCHDCTMEKVKKDAPNSSIIYQASSPDDVALVSGARDMGCTFKSKVSSTVTIEFQGENQLYEVLDVIEFSSARKRMTVIYRYPDGTIKLLCKGADSIIIERLKSENTTEESKVFDDTMEHVQRFATEGLRTLLYSYKSLSQEDYDKWRTRYQEASVALNNRTALMEEVAEEIETNLTLLGATAIEDKLQAQVPETIHKLQRAGIRVWMLTGDKLETAINIGSTCQLIKEHSEVIVFKGLNVEDLGRHVKVASGDIKKFKSMESGGKHVVLVIDGITFGNMEKAHQKILKQHKSKNRKSKLLESVFTQFFTAAVTCNNVICCRFSPSQKSTVVLTVKELLNNSQDGVIGLFQVKKTMYYYMANLFSLRKVSGVTLAIGDGANDIPMLESAHVGIGITGREGLAASRASDYSIAQFRFLQPLLFVHGHYNYRRVALFTLGTFYKSVAFYVCQLFYQIWTGFSGTSLFESWTLSLYNILFSSLPVLAVGIFEKDLRIGTLLGVPEIYRSGQQNLLFNIPIFLRWMFQGLIHAGVAVILPVFVYNAAMFKDLLVGNFTSSRLIAGRKYIDEIFFSDMTGPYGDSSLISLGTISYTIVILVVTLKIGFVEAHNWTIFTAISAGCSIGVWWLYQFIYANLWPRLGEFGYDALGLFYTLQNIQLQIWSIALLGTTVSLVLFDLSYHSIKILWSRWRRYSQNLLRRDLEFDADNFKKTDAVYDFSSVSADKVSEHWQNDDFTYSIRWWQKWEKLHSKELKLEEENNWKQFGKLCPTEKNSKPNSNINNCSNKIGLESNSPNSNGNLHNSSNQSGEGINSAINIDETVY